MGLGVPVSSFNFRVSDFWNSGKAPDADRAAEGAKVDVGLALVVRAKEAAAGAGRRTKGSETLGGKEDSRIGDDLAARRPGADLERGRSRGHNFYVTAVVGQSVVAAAQKMSLVKDV